MSLFSSDKYDITENNNRNAATLAVIDEELNYPRASQPAPKNDEEKVYKNWMYRQLIMNMLVNNSPWTFYDHYRIHFQKEYPKVPFFETLKNAKRGVKTKGNDMPYTIAEVEKMYGGGWVKYKDIWRGPATPKEALKGVLPVLGSIVGGLLVGGPVGAVAGAVAGGTKYAADQKIQSQVMKNEVTATRLPNWYAIGAILVLAFLAFKYFK